jgi:hypothetical protein
MLTADTSLLKRVFQDPASFSRLVSFLASRQNHVIEICTLGFLIILLILLDIGPVSFVFSGTVIPKDENSSRLSRDE